MNECDIIGLTVSLIAVFAIGIWAFIGFRNNEIEANKELKEIIERINKRKNNGFHI